MRFLLKSATLVSFAALALATSANAADMDYQGGYAPTYGHPHHHAYYGGAESPHVIVFDPQAYPAPPAYPQVYAPPPTPYATVAYDPPPRIVAYRRTPSRLNCLVGRPVLDKDVFSGFGIFDACSGEWVR